MDTFSRYAPFIQEFIFNHGWNELHGIQTAAASAIFDTDDHVLLTSGTASGKTEAAFFPILSLMMEDPATSVDVLYIAPLKALINDQFQRLDELTEAAGIPVWRWHGDVSASHKRRLLKQPSGILQITPESLEALLMRHTPSIPALFHDTRFIVIDELHSLLRQDRGSQTLCLIERLARLSGSCPRRIGLSATLGEPERAAELLAAGTQRSCVIPRFTEPNRSWSLTLEHFFTAGPQAGASVSSRVTAGRYEAVSKQVGVRENDLPHAASSTSVFDGVRAPIPVEVLEIEDVPQPSSESLEQLLLAKDRDPDPHWSTIRLLSPTRPYRASQIHPEFQGADPGIISIYEGSTGSKCLVFSNSREEAEWVCSMLRSLAQTAGEPDRFLIHHGNISSSLRESAEELMREDDRADTTVTTATLELGIDIGRLERTFQIDAPFTVSGFLQRLGRTGRRDTPPEMHFIIREEPSEPRSTFPETIPWKLLQGIALIQLYLEDRYVEPPSNRKLPYSLLYHQIMSTLAATGELTPAELASRILTLTPFRRITTNDLRALLHHLIRTDQIELTETGGLIVGLQGERQINSHKFFAVFQENIEYAVRSEGIELGTVVNPPPVGERLAIAGKCWLVEELDYERRVVHCTQIPGRVPAYFGNCAGSIETRVLERMQQALAETETYPYLLTNARARLASARKEARLAHITGRSACPLIHLGEDSWALLPWLGSYAFLALERFLKIRCAKRLGLRGLDASRPYFMQFRLKPSIDAETFFSVLGKEAQNGLDPQDLLYTNEVPRFEKYDSFIPDALVRKGFALGVLDVEGMLARVQSWAQEFGDGSTPAYLPPASPSYMEVPKNSSS
ncbi:DEAD/DEAH box helicase [Collinsella sp. AGMB00827]|uniref:DEAD/DEAH box helicase n=1 Tax=Collinsella ureilytica TaxID=2869515 RepID=A0ABS7MMJ7_9ACTN|nr:DEAD/DEAH box helicase [Collinsella urealyticum]MBY4798295.1 DEAD/DEAH box helicase [Collinsella urealyticum]